MNNTTTGSKLNRRDVLKSAALLGAVGTLGVPMVSSSAVAMSHIEETIYLTNSTASDTTLYTVDLDSTPGQVLLTVEYASTGPNFLAVDAIAPTPDGATVVFVDRNSSHLGEYDVDSGVFTDLGAIAGLPNLTVLAAYGLDGNLYVASNTEDSLYTIDLAGPSATLVGEIENVDVNSADIVFDSFETLFLHSNSTDTLYTVDYQNPSGMPTTIPSAGVGTDPGVSLTGFAVRPAGTGELVRSSRSDNPIVGIDKADASRTATLPMTLNGDGFSYLNGDMTTGFIIDETCVPCDLEESPKYEHVSEAAEDDGESMAGIDGFVAEDAPDAFGYSNYDPKGGEMSEPITVYFNNPCDCCADSLVAMVSAVLSSSLTISVSTKTNLKFVSMLAMLSVFTRSPTAGPDLMLDSHTN